MQPLHTHCRHHHHHHHHLPSLGHCRCPPLLFHHHNHRVHHHPFPAPHFHCHCPLGPSSSTLHRPISAPSPALAGSEGIANLGVSGGDAAASIASATEFQQQEWLRDVEIEDEDEEDAVYVMTDEWKEFFAKSEAKRRLSKQQRNKGQG